MKPVSVTQINEYLAKKIETDFNIRNIAVEGEISGLSVKRHAYFSLKDEQCIIHSVIWKNQLMNIPKELLENGRKVIAVGSVRLYAKGGTYSLQIHYLEDAGIGKAKASFEALKQKLYAEGLFSPSEKKPLPEFPKCVGIVTSTEGDALRDINKIITQKNDYADLLIFPCNVQGIYAASSICSAIEWANQVNRNVRTIDVLIVGRGGGSPEDLEAFNDEAVARCIYASEIPIISAVGHEPDVSISDFVADRRAATPSEAAEMAVPDTFELRRQIKDYRISLLESLRWKVLNERQLAESCKDLLKSNMKNKLLKTRHQIEQAMIHLNEGNPIRILNRGFSVVTDAADKIIADIDAVQLQEEYTIRLRNGSFRANVTTKTKE